MAEATAESEEINRKLVFLFIPSDSVASIALLRNERAESRLLY